MNHMEYTCEVNPLTTFDAHVRTIFRDGSPMPQAIVGRDHREMAALKH